MLEKEQLERIVDLEISKVANRLKAKNISISLNAEARSFLIREGYDPQYGARPMRRAVEKNIEDPLSEHLLRGEVREGDQVQVSVDEDGKRLKFATEAQPPLQPQAP
jgi:ATP-dependent Clp protease ATP-binding subunit ClpC